MGGFKLEPRTNGAGRIRTQDWRTQDSIQPQRGGVNTARGVSPGNPEGKTSALEGRKSNVMSPLAPYAPSHFLTFEPSHLLTAPPISYLPYPISCSSAQGRGLADLFPALRALVLIVVNTLSFLHLHLNLHQTTPYPISL